MKGFKLVLTAIMMSISAYATIPVRILAGDSITPVEGATVISDRGLILGISDSSGAIYIDEKKDFPLTICCVGFEPVTIVNKTDTILLDPATYELTEITVNANERPIMKVLSYVREYCSGATQTDTMQLYAEYMVLNYYPVNEKKVKGYKSLDARFRSLAERRIARFTNSSGKDSIALPRKYDHVSYLSYYPLLVKFPNNPITEPESIRQGAQNDSIMGKFSLVELHKKTDNIYSVLYDRLGDHENHKWSPNLWKMFGLTTDLDKFQEALVYSNPSDSIHSIHDFIYCSGNMHGITKGKMFKMLLGSKNLELNCYAELYPVDIQYLTVEEYKEERTKKDELDMDFFIEPKNLHPLPPAIQRMIKRANDESKTNQNI
ncbi:MAG: hypothetical protein K2N48_00015 [Muribaculaceae bacterium]|nr:hypothetical protein [Muribaculaceae bacterium]